MDLCLKGYNKGTIATIKDVTESEIEIAIQDLKNKGFSIFSKEQIINTTVLTITK